ncbi:MAG: DNRLRE domain-containing protein [Lentimicrobiaceae bacterium]|nr:DNRLRE domain-containing protein [Lentimicrobiaceae bacterium]
MKKLFLFIVLAIVCYSVFSQVTVTFKPNSIIGKDATLATTYGCTPDGEAHPREYNNYGDHPYFRAWTWTLSNLFCYDRSFRSLLQFNELVTIPTEAEIISAELKLFGVPSIVDDPGNSSYPGSTHGTTNESIIQRVTSPWDEFTVTWNTQPSTTTANQILIPNTTAQWNWNFTDNSTNLVDMVQDMVANPNNNFGFMIKLQNETRYRSVIFASSDHANPALWPELTVTYKSCSIDTIVIIDTVYVEKPCPCEANFSYIVNTLNPSSYYFMASNPADGYRWGINGRVVSTESAFSYDFWRNGDYEVCYYIMNNDTHKECRKCINICINQSSFGTNTDEAEEIGLKESEIEDEVIQEAILYEGQISTEHGIEDAKVEVYPNPTTNGFTVRITTGKEETIKIQISDMAGKVVYSDTKTLTIGVNSFNINTQNLIIGNYGLQIIGKTIKSSKILMKK